MNIFNVNMAKMPMISEIASLNLKNKQIFRVQSVSHFRGSFENIVKKKS